MFTNYSWLDEIQDEADVPFHKSSGGGWKWKANHKHDNNHVKQ